MIPCTTQGNTKDPAIVVREFVSGYNGLHKCGTKALKSIQGVSGNVGGSCMGRVLYSLVPPMLLGSLFASDRLGVCSPAPAARMVVCGGSLFVFTA